MPTIELHRTTTATPDRVIEGLTTEAGLRGWWAKDVQATADGYRMRFDKEGRTVTMVFRVDEVGPRHVQWTCLSNDNPVWPGTTLRWSVAEGAVDFVHGGFAEDQSPPFAMTAQGWEHFCNSLVQWAQSGEGQPW